MEMEMGWTEMEDGMDGDGDEWATTYLTPGIAWNDILRSW